MPEIPNDPYPPYPSISETIRRKLFRMRFMNKSVILLGTASVNRGNFEQEWIDKINSELSADKAIYRTPVSVPDTDTITKTSRTANLKIGVYDPLLLLVKEPAVTVEHLFTDMGMVKNGSFKKDFDAIIARHHDVIVTIEPWKDGKKQRDSLLLLHTLKGDYDDIWKSLYQLIASVPQTIYLRWGHEMEIPIDRYPWQKQDPVNYIKAFRYFASLKPSNAGNIKLVWGPAGDRGSVEWWPGADVVDYVSIAIYGLPDKNIRDFNSQQSFSTIFFTKYHRMRFTHKPIFITEFGVKGPEAYQKKWLEDATETINKYDAIKGISYFNFADNPKAWGDTETPVWSITPATFKNFTRNLNGLPHQ